MRYADGPEELYDLASDPFELDNLASLPEEEARLVRLRRDLDELCVPLPPGFPSGGIPVAGMVAALVGLATALIGRREVSRRRARSRGFVPAVRAAGISVVDGLRRVV